MAARLAIISNAYWKAAVAPGAAVLSATSKAYVPMPVMGLVAPKKLATLSLRATTSVEKLCTSSMFSTAKTTQNTPQNRQWLVNMPMLRRSKCHAGDNVYTLGFADADRTGSVVGTVSLVTVCFFACCRARWRRVDLFLRIVERAAIAATPYFP